MANYKNRKPKSFKGCCGMCALRYSNGCRNGRRLTRQEVQQNDRDADEQLFPDVYDGWYDLIGQGD